MKSFLYSSSQICVLIQLSEPFKIFEFDFSKRPNSHGEVELHVKATKDGTIHAVVSWYLSFDKNVYQTFFMVISS